MSTNWVMVGLLSGALAAGCADGRKAEEAQAPEATADAAAPAAAEPAPAPPAVTSAQPSRPAGSSASPTNTSREGATARPTAPAAPRVEYRTLSVPAGTSLALELITPLSSKTAKVETPVRARLKDAIHVDGRAILPAGTELAGTVTEAEGSGRVKGLARIVLAFTEATVAGSQETLQTAPLTFEAKSTKGKDAAVIGVGAGIGAVIGGIADGGSGAAKGAAIGGGAGTGVVLATKGEEVELAAGTALTTTLAQAYTVKVRVK